MAQRSSSGRGGAATATRTRMTSADDKEQIGRLRVDEIRSRLRQRGVPGIWSLRKDQLINALLRALRSEQGGAGGRAKKSTRPAKKSSTTTARKSTTSARKSTGAVSARRNAPSAQKSAAESSARRSAPSTRKAPGGSSAGKTATASSSGGGGGIRTGPTMSRSLKYAQQITSPADRPERPGRSLVTTNHEVIQQWARARQAKPATIEGTERDGRPGVLTFNFPGWREGGKLKTVTWDDWFRTFDSRQVNFIYQEQKSDGRQSNFFRTESPVREDA
jgi:hypothetical protein